MAQGKIRIPDLNMTGTPSSANFLRGDGTWEVPAGTGDMAKAVYDTDNSGVVDNAEGISIVGRNATGGTLYKGTIVYLLLSTGNRPNFVKAQANSEATSAGTMGVISNDILNNADGNCCTIGYIDTLDTRPTATNPFTSDTLVDGDTIYLSPTTAGYITNVKPVAPNHLVYLGKVTRTSPTNGTIVYRVQNGYELEELHNVLINGSLTNNEVLTYETSSLLWKPKSISTILGYTPYNGTTNPNGYTTNLGTVTNVSALTLGTTGTDLSSTVATGTTTPVITLNVPTASATNRGVLSSTDWTAFNNKQNALTNPVTGTGTSGTVPIFTGTSTLGNSLMTGNASTMLITSTADAVPLTVKSTLGAVSTIGFQGTTSTNGFNTRLGASGNDIVFYTTNTEKVRITSGGNFLVGDTLSLSAPWRGTGAFGINGSDKVIIGNLNSTYVGATIGGHNSAVNAWADLNIVGGDIIFRYQENETLRINTSGNIVSLGTVTATNFIGPGTGLTGTATSLNIGGNSATSSNVFSAGGGSITSSTQGTAYSTCIQVREKNNGGAQASAMTAAPRLAFHWSGVVASSIAMEPGGRIAIMDNPGTGYENFVAKDISASSSFNGPGTGLTGTAASLSIGGNAATASELANFTNQSGNRYSTDFNTILSTGFFNALGTPTNSPGGSYGQLISAKGIDTGLQIYGGYTNDNLWFRGWHSSGTFTSWRTILHNNNFNTYAPTLTGTGASGTWGISVTGTAGSAPNSTNLNVYYGVTANENNGIRFWDASTTYSIAMGLTAASYQYGPVTDYSIKFSMGGAAGRGFVWGQYGSTPIAALNSTSGNFQVAGTSTATGFYNSSDARLKDIIKRDGDVAYFKWKDCRDDQTHIGYIAQEVQVENKEQVNENSDGFLSVNYIEILVQKVRELEKQIELLKIK